MKNPVPGKNPFELESYKDKMPKHVRQFYEDMTSNYKSFKGRTGRGRFWRLTIFGLIYFSVIPIVLDRFSDTNLIYAMLLLLAWLYMAIPMLTIGVRRLHDAGYAPGWSWLPQLMIFYWLFDYSFRLAPNTFVWGFGALMCFVSYIFMSLPSVKTSNEFGPVPEDV